MVSPAIAALQHATREVLVADANLVSEETLLADLEALHELERQVRVAQQTRLRSAFDRAVIAEHCGRSVRSWLIEEQLLNPAEASRRMRLLHELPARPATHAAHTAAAISDAHALVVLSALRQLRHPERLDPVEAVLLELCREQPPFEVARAVDAILAGLGIESSADAAAARRYSQRNVSPARTFGGTGSLAGTLTPELAEKLQLLFTDCAKTQGEEDDRDAGQRRHDRLEEILDHYLAGAALPTVNGERPRLIVTIDWQALHDELSDRSGILDSGVPISPATARRLACDAELIPVVLAGPGRILDLDVTDKPFTPAVKLAAKIRDRGRCGFPHCRRRIAECHHIIWLSRGGTSDLTNAVWLCAFHHWLAHEGGWTLTRNPDNSYTWTNRHGRTITGDPPPQQPQAA